MRIGLGMSLDYSLFLNTRKRVPVLSNLLDSIVNTTYDIDKLESLITVDDDDTQSIEFVQSYHAIPNLKLIIKPRPSNLHTNINKMASQSVGSFLFVLNDDVVFLTQHWDKITNQFYQDRKNDIYYLATTDTSIDKTKQTQYSSFPMLTRKAYNTLGYFMSDKFVSHGGDVHLWRIFNSVDRILKTPIVLDHVMHNSQHNIQQMRKDLTAQEAIEMTFNNFVNCWDEDITKEIKLIKDAI